jgi:hypothetical protein
MMRPPRFRLRAQMIAVAVVAVLLGGDAFRRRRTDRLALARYHAGEARFNVSHAGLWERGQDGGCMEVRDATPEGYARAAAECRLLAAHHAALSLKYERAARYPWLPVGPNPPESE